MKVSEIRDLIRVKPLELDATRRRLSACPPVSPQSRSLKMILITVTLTPAECC